jgi:hypothetical protein
MNRQEKFGVKSSRFPKELAWSPFCPSSNIESDSVFGGVRSARSLTIYRATEIDNSR